MTDLKNLISLSYINLEKRKDRKKSIEANLLEYGFNLIKVSRFNAFKDEFGEIGCAKSHFLLLSKLLCQSNTKYHIILEDDFRFNIHLTQLLGLIRLIETSEIDLDIFHLYILRPIAQVVTNYSFEGSEANLCKITYGQSTAAYIIREDKITKLAKNFLNSLSALQSHIGILKNSGARGAFNMRFAIDNLWSQTQVLGNCYAFDVQIGSVEEGFSDVTRSVKSIQGATMQRPFGHNKFLFKP